MIMKNEAHEEGSMTSSRLRGEEVVYLELNAIANVFRLGFDEFLPLLDDICQVLHNEVEVLGALSNGYTGVAGRASHLRSQSVWTP